MSTVMDRNVEKMEKILEEEKTSADVEAEIASLERMKYRLSDAIREGSKVSGQAYGWTGADDSMCAMSAAVTAAMARGYMDK